MAGKEMVTAPQAPERLVKAPHALFDRVKAKLQPRAQSLRYCGEPLLTFELPALVDPALVSLEQRLQDRGDAVKRRLQDEAKRLRDGDS